MEKIRMPKPGEIFNHDNKPYQVITVATHSLTGESMVVYQLLYGDFKIYVKSLSAFLNELEKFPQNQAVKEKGIHHPGSREEQIKEEPHKEKIRETGTKDQVLRGEAFAPEKKAAADVPEGSISDILIQFLDADTYSKKLEIITTNAKRLNDRLINDMAVSLDCAVDEGPLDKRIQELIYCLQAMRRFEDRRLR